MEMKINIHTNEAVELTKKFITEYFMAYETLKMPSFGYVVKNNETGLFATLLEYQLESCRAHKDPYKNVQIEGFEVKKAEMNGNRMCIDVYVKLNYSYTQIETNTKMGGFYLFELQNVDNQLMIVKIDSDAADYEYHKFLIAEKAKEVGDKAAHEVTKQLIEDLPRQMTEMEKYIAEMEVTAGKSKILDKEREEQDQKAISLKAVNTTFVANDARHYGWFWGSWKQNMIFRKASLDCTNFVSQCIWAGYNGAYGYTDKYGSQETSRILKERVATNFKQTSTWMGRNYDSPYVPSNPAWVSVEALWNHASTNTGNGPRAYALNNGAHWSKIAGFTSKFLGGDVLQFGYLSSGPYTHSVIVENKVGVPIAQGLSQVTVAQHTDDLSERPLKELIKQYGDSNCKMRMLRFKNSTFDR